MLNWQELRRTTTELDSLRERSRISTEAQLAERARLEQRLEDQAESLRRSEGERAQLVERARELSQQLAQSEEQLRVQMRLMSEVREEADQQRVTSNQLRLVADQAEQMLEDTRRLAHSKELDVDELTHRVRFSNIEPLFAYKLILS